jgi:hypothetical protein
MSEMGAAATRASHAFTSVKRGGATGAGWDEELTWHHHYSGATVRTNAGARLCPPWPLCAARLSVYLSVCLSGCPVCAAGPCTSRAAAASSSVPCQANVPVSHDDDAALETLAN